MVEFVLPRLSPDAPAPVQVNPARADQLNRLAGAVDKAAGTFTEYYEEKAALERDRILAETQEHWSRTYDERAKGAGGGFAKSIVEEYRKDAATRIENGPVRGREQLQLALDKFGMRLEGRALAAEAAARARAAAAARAEARRSRGNAIISDPGLLEQAVEQDPKNADYYTKLALSARLMSDPAAIRDEVQAGKWDKNLSPSEKMTFLKQGQAGVDRNAREAEAALSVERKSFESALDEEIAYTAANGAPPADSVFADETLERLYDAETAATVRESYTAAVDYAETLHGVTNANPIEIQETIGELAAAVREPGSTEQDVSRLNTYAAAVEEREKAISEDAATFALRGSDTISEALEYYQNAGPEDRDVAAEAYLAALDQRYDALGVSAGARRALPKPLADHYARTFNEMEADVAAQTLGEFLSQWGDPRIYAELTAAELAPEYAVAMRHADKPGLAAEIASLRGVPEKDLREGLPSTAPTDMETELDASLAEFRIAFEMGDTTGKARETFNMNFGVARKLGLKYMREGADPASAAERVIERMFPEGVLSEPQARVIYPEGMREATVSGALEAAREPDILRSFDLAPLDDPRLPEFADLEVMIESAASQGVWLNNSTGDGAVLHLNIGGYLLPLTLKDGTYYERKFAEIGSATQATASRQLLTGAYNPNRADLLKGALSE